MKQTNSGLGRYGSQVQLYKRNRKIILATQEVCGICGNPVDKTLKAGDPLAPVVDHIIPWDISHDCSLGNLQLAHACCNRQKSDKVPQENKRPSTKETDNRNLPKSFDWLQN